MTMRRRAINDALERGDTRWPLHLIGAERQLTHDPDPALARHAATLSLTGGRSVPVSTRTIVLLDAPSGPLAPARACRARTVPMRVLPIRASRGADDSVNRPGEPIRHDLTDAREELRSAQVIVAAKGVVTPGISTNAGRPRAR